MTRGGQWGAAAACTSRQQHAVVGGSSSAFITAAAYRRGGQQQRVLAADFKPARTQQQAHRWAAHRTRSSTRVNDKQATFIAASDTRGYIDNCSTASRQQAAALCVCVCVCGRRRAQSAVLIVCECGRTRRPAHCWAALCCSTRSPRELTISKQATFTAASDTRGYRQQQQPVRSKQAG